MPRAAAPRITSSKDPEPHPPPQCHWARGVPQLAGKSTTTSLLHAAANRGSAPTSQPLPRPHPGLEKAGGAGRSAKQLQPLTRIPGASRVPQKPQQLLGPEGQLGSHVPPRLPQMGELQLHRPRRHLPDLQRLGSTSPLGSKEGISPISLKIHSTCPTSLTPGPVKPPQSPRLTGGFSLTGHRCAPRRSDATARAEERASRAPSQRTCVPALELGKWSGLEVVEETATSGRGKRPAPRLPRYPRMAGPTPPQDPGLSSGRGAGTRRPALTPGGGPGPSPR